MPSKLEEIIHDIGRAESTETAMFLFDINKDIYPELQEYKFVFASENGISPGYAVNKTFSAGCAIKSLFKTDKILVLDKETHKEMFSSGVASIPIDFSIAMDLQVMSYFAPYMDSKKNLPPDFHEVFAFIARDDVNVDPLPYMMENQEKINDDKTVGGLVKTFRAYEIFRTIDKKHLRKKNKIRSEYTDKEISARALEHLKRMQLSYGNEEYMNELRFMYQRLYALLLKMAILQLTNPKTRPEDAQSKLIKILEFCDEQLATMFLREIKIAKRFFDEGASKFDFFGLVQKNRGGLLIDLQNMAWDLFHVRQMELRFKVTCDEQARYFFPAFLTNDKKLVEVIDICPLKSIAFRAKGKGLYPIFEESLEELLISIGSDFWSDIGERYFTVQARAFRDARHELARQQLPEVIARLEYDLMSIK